MVQPALKLPRDRRQRQWPPHSRTPANSPLALLRSGCTRRLLASRPTSNSPRRALRETSSQRGSSSQWLPLAGVDALSTDQLRGILRGEKRNWADVGGIPGPIRCFVFDWPGMAVVAAWAGPAGGQLCGGQTTVASFDALREAMALDSGGFAFVPIGELRPSLVAIAIDGVDIARGFSDAKDWPLSTSVAVIARTERGRNNVTAVREAVAAKPPVVTRIVATGDVLQSRCSLAAIKATGDWAAALRGPVGEYLAAADLALSSLDGSIQGIGEPYLCVPRSIRT